jgi:4'-phosphopantetheinyl transferase EntD
LSLEFGAVPRLALAAEDVRRALPRAVGVGVRRLGFDGVLPALEPGEQELLGPRAVQRRRVSFALGRAAARDALADIGVEPSPIGRGPGGEPLWPTGIVGAISHSGEVAIAVVGRVTDYAGLGLDVEQLSPGLSARASELVCTAAERAWLAGGPEYWRTMLFSAKEAVFKALYPIERVWLGFSDAELAWRPERCGFDARLLKRASEGYPVGSGLEVSCTLTDAEVLSTTFARPWKQP